MDLIKIVIKHIHKLGFNTPIFLVFFYIRIKDFHNLIIAIIEFNLNDAPIYFKCHPNYSMSLLKIF